VSIHWTWIISLAVGTSEQMQLKQTEPNYKRNLNKKHQIDI